MLKSIWYGICQIGPEIRADLPQIIGAFNGSGKMHFTRLNHSQEMAIMLLRFDLEYDQIKEILGYEKGSDHLKRNIDYQLDRHRKKQKYKNTQQKREPNYKQNTMICRD